MPRQRRPARPTLRELNLLAYPPTPTTWLCTNHEGFWPISGSLEACWACGTPKGERPKLVWPMYLVACKKVKTKPTGKRWTPETEEPLAARKPVKRRVTRKRA